MFGWKGLFGVEVRFLITMYGFAIGVGVYLGLATVTILGGRSMLPHRVKARRMAESNR